MTSHSRRSTDMSSLNSHRSSKLFIIYMYIYRIITKKSLLKIHQDLESDGNMNSGTQKTK